MRVLLLAKYGRLGASSRLRTLQYLPRLREHGFDVVVEPLLDDDYVRRLYAGHSRLRPVLAGYARRLRALRSARRFDVLWVEKEALPWLPWVVEAGLLPAGVRLVVDYDDAIFHRYDTHRSALVRAALGGRIPALMRRADVVVAGNRYLADKAVASGARRVEIVPTVVDLDRYAPRPPPTGDAPPVVGWIGSPDTVRFLARRLDAIRDAAAAHGGTCVAVGARPDQLAGTGVVAEPWSEATEAAAIARFDVGVMPLEDTPWERGKCAYKLVQYMASGVPVVASPVGANVDVVHDGEHGFLADDADAWRDAIDRLLREPRLRARMGAAGRARVERDYSLQGQWRRVAALLAGAE